MAFYHQKAKIERSSAFHKEPPPPRVVTHSLVLLNIRYNIWVHRILVLYRQEKCKIAIIRVHSSVNAV